MQGIYLVLTVPHKGMAEQYHHWYNTRHIPDILAVPGVAFARRYALSRKKDEDDALPFAAFYGFSDVRLAVPEIVARRGTPRLTPSPAVDRTLNQSCIFEMTLNRIEHLLEGDSFDFGLLQKLPKQPPAEILTAGAASVQAAAGRPRFTAIQFLQARVAMSEHPLAAFDPYADAYRADPISPFVRNP